MTPDGSTRGGLAAGAPRPTGWPRVSPGCAGRCAAAPGSPARATPLAVAQLELLSALAEHPGTRPGQLARLLHMRPNTVTTIVNALTAQGMISRATAEGDRRAIELTITDAGQQAVHSWQATNAAVLHLALSTLPPGQRRALAAAVPALDALARAVDRLADAVGSPADRTPGELPGPAEPGQLARPTAAPVNKRADPPNLGGCGAQDAPLYAACGTGDL